MVEQRHGSELGKEPARQGVQAACTQQGACTALCMSAHVVGGASI